MDKACRVDHLDDKGNSFLRVEQFRLAAEVEVEGPCRQYDDERSDGFPLAVKVIAGDLLQLGHHRVQLLANVREETVQVTLRQLERVHRRARLARVLEARV